MMKKGFQIYQYLALLVLFPWAGYLWLNRYDGNQEAVLVVMLIPILYSYIVPALGTNWLKLWEFDTRFKLGRFRAYHGFVFGSATSLVTCWVLPYSTGSFSVLEGLWAGFVLGSILAFWNWVYDLLAIKAGFIKVYNRAWSEGRSPAEISMAYAPVTFGAFGFVYGIIIHFVERVLLAPAAEYSILLVLISGVLVAIVVSVGGYSLFSWITIGESGFRSYEDEKQESE